jgi:hypothetical protein
MINHAVIITDKNSNFCGRIGKIISKGNGNLWQIEIIKGCGIYFDRKQFLLISNEK